MAHDPTHEEDLLQLGYLDVDVDPRIDLFEEIEKLKREKNALILAHYYQDPDIQDIADYVGDAFGISQRAVRADADVIVVAGVHFLAETAKVLNPTKKVLLPDLRAGCSLVESCPVPAFRRFIEQYPDHVVVSHIASAAELKALSDICCTSANAVAVIDHIPEDQPIVFVPDFNLGTYIQKQTGRELVLWDGSCEVHQIFSLEQIVKLQQRYPEAHLIAHPECPTRLLDQADFVGATSALLHYVRTCRAQAFIVATESGIIHQMRKCAPHKTFIPAPPDNICACNECPHMKRNTMEKLYTCMKYELPDISLPEWIIEQARPALDRMLDFSTPIVLKT